MSAYSDIRRTRRVEPDEARFVAVRDGARERCITCRGFFVADEPRVPMPALGAIPRGNAHPACKELVRDRYLAVLGGWRSWRPCRGGCEARVASNKVIPIERRYLPSSGSEGYDFEQQVCGSCDRYRYLERGDDAMDCNLGIIDVAYMAERSDESTWPPEWVYREGRPTCKKWIRRKAGADARVPLLCGGATTPEREREAYERAMRGE